LLEGTATAAESLSSGARDATGSGCLRVRAILASTGLACTAGAAGKLSAAKSAPAARLSRGLRVIARASSRGICGRICWRSRGCGSLRQILLCSRRGFYGRERRNFERHVDCARTASEVELLRGVIETKLAYFDAVMPGGQSRQIKAATFIGPTDPGAPAHCFDETKICTGNGKASGSANDASGSRSRRPFGLRGLRGRG
jgi:hypothetical protein